MAEHCAVWSPLLVDRIFESCSQLDPLWKLRAGPGDKSKMPDYFVARGSVVAGEWVVVWGDEGLQVQPFSQWVEQTGYVPLP